jgi:hypothetical protein
MNVWFLNADEGLIWMEAEAGGKITIRETLCFFEATVSGIPMVSRLAPANESYKTHIIPLLLTAFGR